MRIVDTKNIAKFNSIEKINIHRNIEKIESGITIKLLETFKNKSKKMVVKNLKYIYLYLCIEHLKL